MTESMIDLVCISIAVGLAVSLIFSESLGKAAGGFVVPGYLALHLTRPVDIALTLVTAMATYGIVHFASSALIIYGKRRTAAMILVGFWLGAGLRLATAHLAPSVAGIDHPEYTVIGFIIPGLIAIWFDRQGLLDTCSTTLTASVVVRLLLVLFAASQLEQFEAVRTPVEPPTAIAPSEQVEPAEVADLGRDESNVKLARFEVVKNR